MKRVHERLGCRVLAKEKNLQMNPQSHKLDALPLRQGVPGCTVTQRTSRDLAWSGGIDSVTKYPFQRSYEQGAAAKSDASKS
jgi:hypothetical protein